MFLRLFFEGHAGKKNKKTLTSDGQRPCFQKVPAPESFQCKIFELHCFALFIDYAEEESVFKFSLSGQETAEKLDIIVIVSHCLGFASSQKSHKESVFKSISKNKDQHIFSSLLGNNFLTSNAHVTFTLL